MTTLDTLIDGHGIPAFIKLDVEGFEAEALAGLSHPAAALSFEFTTIQRDVALACLARCTDLGYTRSRFSNRYASAIRLTNGFSKKIENMQAAAALHFTHHNFVRMHKTLCMTPAMAANVETGLWSLQELVERTSK
jgi:hypothetical protein